MSPELRRFLITELIKGIGTVGPQYEEFGTRLVDHIVNDKMQHRGLNPHGHPVGHVVDSVSETGVVAAEYSAEQDYFESPFSKIFKDLRHSRKLHPQAKRVLLLSSHECGPKAHTQLVNLRARIKRCMGLDLEILDSRRQAEYIVDRLLLNDAAIDAISPFLAPLDKVRTEFAASNLVPQLSAGYLRRANVESEVVRLIRTERFAALAGLSGTGKSETTVAVARELAGEFEMVVWVPAETIQAVDDLHAVDVERRCNKLNLFHLLRERSCLVILDDLRFGLSATELKHHCGEKSAILVTRQSAFDGDVRIPFLDRDEARTLLEQNVAGGCPDNVFDVVWNTVGGHPLALRLLNAGVRHGSWDELSGDCAAIGQYPDGDRVQRLADRLLGRLERLLEKELAFFAWCSSARVDRSFARRVLSSVGLRKLDDACLLVADRNDVLRLHDIVLSAISTLLLPVEKYATGFDEVLDSYVEDLVFGTPSALSFLTFCQVHGSKLDTLLRANPDRSTCLYCLTHTWSDQGVDLPLLGNPISRANAITSSGAPKDIEVCAVCEAIEAIYRKVKHDSGLEAAREVLERNLTVFTSLAAAPGISAYGRRTALHHHAKALRNLQRYDEAIAICESILAELSSPATKLLLARLLIFSKDKKTVERAKDLLFELLEEAKTSPATAEISITLAAIETLGRWQLKDYFRESLARFGGLVTDYIIESAARGFDLAFVAFASIGRELRYSDQPLFVYVFEHLPRRTPDETRDDKEQAAWGDILLAASEAASLNQRERLATEALRFYEALQKPNPYNLQQQGHALVLLNRLADAAELLQPVVAGNPNPWNRYWLSKALFGLGDSRTALTLIDQALDDPKAKTFKAALHQHRWEIRKAGGDASAIDDLQMAYELCEDEKHKASLAAKLAAEGATSTR